MTSVNDYIDMALKANKDIRSAQYALDSAKENARINSALPDPMLMIEGRGIPADISQYEETREWMVMISQPFPFPGKPHTCFYQKHRPRTQGACSASRCPRQTKRGSCGGVVVRYGQNPLQAMQAVKDKIEEIAPGLPQKTLQDGNSSQVTIVPFYDRTELIYETLNTLRSGLSQQILVTVIVVILLVMHLCSSVLISAMLPLAVLMTFIAMKLFRVDANIVALSGIVIAVGTIVDIGIVIAENIYKHLKSAAKEASALQVVFNATRSANGKQINRFGG